MSRTAVLLKRPARHVWAPKGAADVLDYSVDWTARLDAGDGLAHSEFVLPLGLSAERASNTAQVSTVWISGGEAGRAYEVVNSVRTAQGRAIEQAIKLRVKS